MPQSSAQVTAADISRIAGVTRATVSNWRRRHRDFPAPAGGTDASPLYDLEAVRAWLRTRGQDTAASPAEELRTLLRLHSTGGLAARLLPLVLAASRHSPAELAALAALSDAELAARATKVTAALAGEVPDAASVRFRAEDVPALRALARCVREQGAQSALDVLAERELEDSASTGTYTTPQGLADLMAALLPPDAALVLDPACGSGTLLSAAARRGARELYGQDAHPVQAQRTAVRLLLSSADGDGHWKVTAVAGDSLRSDAFPDLAADAVLCNPPYGDRDWGHDELAYDSRWAYGVPPRAESELAWVQHALAHLAPGGHAVLLLPAGTAFRSSGRRVRAELVRSGTLRAVVGLPAGAAIPLHVALQLWVLQRPEPDGPERTSVLFVDAGTGAGTGEADGRADKATSRQRAGSPTATGRRHRTLDWDELTSTVLHAWRAFTAGSDAAVDEPGVARTVPLLDLVDEVADLTPARQVRAAPVDTDPSEVARLAREQHGLLRERAKTLVRATDRDTWQPVDGSARTWRTATVSDLARGGALEVLRAAPQPKDEVREKWQSAQDGRPVLTGPDITRGDGPSGDLDDLPAEISPVVEEGDVIVRGPATGSGPMTHVAGTSDAGALLGRHLFLLRPDPARLDPHFLAGFLGAEDNIAAASTGSTIVQVQPGRLRVPLLPLAEQRRYGGAFRRISALRTAARHADDLAREASRIVTSGLTAGTLQPPG